jgi:CRP-like cAMP-binding protein
VHRPPKPTRPLRVGRELVVGSMVQMGCSRGHVVIREGDPGHDFYVVGQGEVHIFKLPATDAAAQPAPAAVEEGSVGVDFGQRVQECSSGMGFGELALMYNVPRQAS